MVTREFTFERATKNTLRYKENEGQGNASDPGLAVGILYVQKWVFDGQPQRIRVTVEEVQATS